MSFSTSGLSHLLLRPEKGLRVILSSLSGASLQTNKERGRKTAHKVTTEKERHQLGQDNIYLSPFLGSVFLSSCMLLKQRKSLRT